MFPKSTISFKRQNANDEARRKISDACSTAAIVAELFPATKMGGQMGGRFASGMFLPAEPPAVIYLTFTGRVIRWVKMAVNSRFDLRGLFDCPSDLLFFSPFFKQF